MLTHEQENLIRYTGPAKEIGLREWFYPFEFATQFLPHDLSQVVKRPEYHSPGLLITPFRCMGARGTIELFAEYPGEIDNHENDESPLGDAFSIIAYGNRDVKAFSLPLRLRTFFLPRNMVQVIDLSRTIAQYDLAQSIYYSNYGDEDDVSEAELNLTATQYPPTMKGLTLVNVQEKGVIFAL